MSVKLLKHEYAFLKNPSALHVPQPPQLPSEPAFHMHHLPCSPTSGPLSPTSSCSQNCSPQGQHCSRVLGHFLSILQVSKSQ